MKKLLIKVSLAAVVVGLVLPAFAGDLSSNDVFKTKCAMCHGAKGEGKAAMKTTPLTAPEVTKKTDAELTALISKGKPPKMPAYEGKLTPDQIKSLVAAIKGGK